jgi:hypothetical protein
MKSRKTLLALAVAAAALGGCATYPYDDPYYQQQGYYRDSYGNPYYAPGYYTGPSVGFGITYTDRNDYWRHRHYR